MSTRFSIRNHIRLIGTVSLFFILSIVQITVPSLVRAVDCSTVALGNCTGTPGCEVDAGFCVNVTQTATCSALSLANCQGASGCHIDVGSNACVSSTVPSPSSAPTQSLPPATPFLTPNLEIPVPNITFTSILQTACPNNCVNSKCQDTGDTCSTNADCPVSSSTCLTIPWITQYVTGFYKFLLGFSIVIAIIMIMIGGLQYLMAASTGDTKAAKERITNASVGLVLLFSVTLILYTVGGNWLSSLAPLQIKSVALVPLASVTTYNESDTASCTSGGNLYGVSTFQDCMLNKYGTNQAAIQLQTVTFDGQSFQVNTQVASSLQAANTTLLASGVSYPIINDGASGGFNWRCNKNSPLTLSDHAFGTAIDINPSTNPNCPAACSDPTKKCNCIGGNNCVQLCQSAKPYDIPPAVINALTGNGFTWGGNFSGTKDYMHFDFNSGC